MKSYPFDWRARSLRAALMAGFLLSTSLASSVAAVQLKTEEPPLPSRKTDDDPPLPSKKPAPAKPVRVEVTASSAEVRAGDMVIATVTRGEVLSFTKKTDE